MAQRVQPPAVWLAALVLVGCAADSPPPFPEAGLSSDEARTPTVVQVGIATGEGQTDRTSILAALEQVHPGDTVQFAPGTYLVGELIPVPIPQITFVGHAEGTVLRGCDPAEYEEMEREVARAFGTFNPVDEWSDIWAVLKRCGMLELTGGHGTIRNLTFEYTRMGVILGCCHAERTHRPTEGGYLIEGNTFRNSGNSIRAVLSSSEPTVIRQNQFRNVFHAVSAAASHLSVVDNDIRVPEPGRVPGVGHPGFGIGIGAPQPTSDDTLSVCEHNIIAGNRIEGHETGIVLFGEPGTACRQNVVRANTIMVRRVPMDPARSVADVTNETDRTIVGVPMTLHNPSGDGLLEDNRIEENQIIGAEGIGIEVLRASRNRIANNTITGVMRREPFPGNTLGGDAQRWAVANGSAIWVSPESDENAILRNTLSNIAGWAIVIEGDRNHIEFRDPVEAARDLGRGNRITGSR
jgi:parallel beta-helix repeat protein